VKLARRCIEPGGREQASRRLDVGCDYAFTAGRLSASRRARASPRLVRIVN